MTDLEAFKLMLYHAGMNIEEHRDEHCISILFEMAAGIGGSSASWTEAIFDPKTEKLRTICHCD